MEEEERQRLHDSQAQSTKAVRHTVVKQTRGIIKVLIASLEEQKKDLRHFFRPVQVASYRSSTDYSFLSAFLTDRLCKCPSEVRQDAITYYCEHGFAKPATAVDSMIHVSCSQ